MSVSRKLRATGVLPGVCFFLLAAWLSLGAPVVLAQEFTIVNSVFGNGGGTLVGDENVVVGTLGQPAVGEVEDTIYWLLSGIGHDTIGVLWTDVSAEVEQVSSGPMDYRLDQNFPNPFNPATTIRFALPRTSHVELALYNVLGQRVAILLDERLEFGEHIARFEAGSLPSGVYFYRLRADGFVKTRKLILLR